MNIVRNKKKKENPLISHELWEEWKRRREPLEEPLKELLSPESSENDLDKKFDDLSILKKTIV